MSLPIAGNVWGVSYTAESYCKIDEKKRRAVMEYQTTDRTFNETAVYYSLGGSGYSQMHDFSPA